MNNTSNVIQLMGLGACLLAAAYHFVLYIYYRDKLLLHYVAYLFCMSLFIFIRSEISPMVFGNNFSEKIIHDFNEGLQVLYFALYINFGAHAVKVPLNKKSFVYKGWVILSLILMVYAAAITVLHFNNIFLPAGFFIMIRLFIFAMSFVLLWRCFKMEVSVFQIWILSGCIYFFICGLMSFITNALPVEKILFDPLGWLQIGNFGEVLFFSSAMGYRLKRVNDEKQEALASANEEKAISQQLRFEKANAIIQARRQERDRIARDMHDDLGSGLTKIAILSEVVKTQLHEPGKAKLHLENISASSRELVDSLQDIVWVLNPGNDTVESLATYVREYALKFFDSMDIEIYFFYPDEIADIKLSEEQRRNIFLVIKETFNNIAKHARCNKVGIHLLSAAGIEFIIEDNGKGFNLCNRSTSGNGLQNMKNRMQQAGGFYEINSIQGQGTITKMKLAVTLFGDKR